MPSDDPTRPPPRVRAFTLVELMVVIAIIAVLAGVLLPALGAGRHASWDLKCRAQLRPVAAQFTAWADEGSSVERGDSTKFGRNRFRMEDFQESVYRVNEFWDAPETDRAAIEAKSLLNCPAGPGSLVRRSGMPCSAGAVGPQRNVSIGFNMRLHQRSRLLGNRPVRAQAFLSDRILQFPDVPLAFDVDGVKAADVEQLPYYSAPALDNLKTPDIYATGAFWFPSYRHRTRMNVVFVGGHVLSTADPLQEPWWRWDYSPE